MKPRFSTFFPTFLSLVGATALLAQEPPRPEIYNEIADQELAVAGANTSIDLSGYFRFLIENGVNGEVARFTTSLGVFDVELRSDWAPNHVVNFKTYVNEGRYDETIIHRTAYFEDQETRAIVQGGGFTNGIPPAQLAAHAPVRLEYRQFNLRGTLAAARTSDPDSATTGWYFNVLDNTEILGSDILAGQIGYTVFGGVLSSGMDVVDAMAEVDVFNGTQVFGGAFEELPLVDYETSDGLPTKDNFINITNIAMVPHYPTTPGGPGALTFTASSDNPAVVGASISGRNLILDPGITGTAVVTVVASDIRGYELTQQFDVSVGSPIMLTTQPVSQTVAAGGNTTFSVAASSDQALTYQWYRNGTAISGATSASLALTSLSAAQNGAYHVVVNGTETTRTSRTAYLQVATPNPGRIVNESVNTTISPGTSLTVGFVIDGGDKTMLIRGMGPTLAQPPFNLGNVQNDLSISLFQAGNSTTPLETNAGWANDTAIAAAAAEVGAFAFASTDDAAVLRAMTSGSYTAVLSATGTTAGTAIMEAYATDPSATTGGRLVNLSALKRIDNANTGLTAGFSISGNVPKKVLLRAVGPSLTTVAPGIEALADPTLKVNRLVSASGLEPLGEVLENDDWQDEGDSAQTEAAAALAGAFPLVAGSADASVLVTLPAGNYTVSVVRKGTQVGNALIEVYEIP